MRKNLEFIAHNIAVVNLPAFTSRGRQCAAHFKLPSAGIQEHPGRSHACQGRDPQRRSSHAGQISDRRPEQRYPRFGRVLQKAALEEGVIPRSQLRAQIELWITVEASSN
jgi:hypothetical protein